MYSLGRGYEPIDSPYSTPYGAMVLPRIAHRNPVSYYRMLWTAARYSLSRSPQPLQTRRFSLPVPLLFPYLFLASYIRGKLHPADGYNANGRGLSATGFMHLSIPIYPFAQEQCFLFPWINVHWPGRMVRAVLSHRFPTLRINVDMHDFRLEDRTK